VFIVVVSSFRLCISLDTEGFWRISAPAALVSVETLHQHFRRQRLAPDATGRTAHARFPGHPRISSEMKTDIGFLSSE
jgi:hypothetical protein